MECPKLPSYLMAELRIDGQQLGEKYALDLLQLTRALAQTWERFIFTCAYGLSDCPYQ